MSRQRTRRQDPAAQFRSDVAAYVAAGGDPEVQRVVTAVHGLSKRLDTWYDRQLADLSLSSGEWAVLSRLAREPDCRPMTPSQLAEAVTIAPSSMTHRVDGMVQRGLVTRTPDPDNRTRVLIELAPHGWQLFRDAIAESNLVEADLLAGVTVRQRAELADLLEQVIASLDT